MANLLDILLISLDGQLDEFIALPLPTVLNLRAFPGFEEPADLSQVLGSFIESLQLGQTYDAMGPQPQELHCIFGEEVGE